MRGLPSPPLLDAERNLPADDSQGGRPWSRFAFMWFEIRLGSATTRRARLISKDLLSLSSAGQRPAKILSVSDPGAWQATLVNLLMAVLEKRRWPTDHLRRTGGTLSKDGRGRTCVRRHRHVAAGTLVAVPSARFAEKSRTESPPRRRRTRSGPVPRSATHVDRLRCADPLPDG